MVPEGWSVGGLFFSSLLHLLTGGLCPNISYIHTFCYSQEEAAGHEAAPVESGCLDRRDEAPEEDAECTPFVRRELFPAHARPSGMEKSARIGIGAHVIEDLRLKAVKWRRRGNERDLLGNNVCDVEDCSQQVVPVATEIDIVFHARQPGVA